MSIGAVNKTCYYIHHCNIFQVQMLILVTNVIRVMRVCTEIT